MQQLTVEEVSQVSGGNGFRGVDGSSAVAGAFAGALGGALSGSRLGLYGAIGGAIFGAAIGATGGAFRDAWYIRSLNAV